MSENWEIELNNIEEQVTEWREKFIGSRFYNQLTEIEQEEMNSIIEAFVDFSYRYFEVQPEEWAPEQVKRCCAEIMPSKVAADDDFFNSLPGVLAAFFEFLADRNILAQGEELAQAVQSVREEITTAAADSENWSLGKNLVQSAQQAGIDLTDERELDEFITDYNQEQMDQLEAGFKQEPKRNNPDWDVGRNEPCPCGSGKKYKKCCLREIKRQQPYNRALDKLLDKLFDFFWAVEGAYQQKLADYFSDFAQGLGIPLPEMPPEAEMLVDFNAIFDLQLEGEQTALEMFAEQEREELSVKERSVLASLVGRRLKIYQITSQEQNRYRVDNLFTEETVSITERVENFQPGDIVVGRLAEVGNEVQLVGFFDTVPAHYKELITDEIGSWIAAFEAQQPEFDWDQFWRQEAARMMGLFAEISEMETGGVDIVREVNYSLQAPEVAQKRLLKQPNIIEEESEEDFTVLIWLAEEEVGPKVEIKGRFIVDESELVYITPFVEQITAGKELIESELGFIANYKEEYRVDTETGEIVEWITRNSEVSQQIIEDFIGSPLPSGVDDQERTPQELARTKEGREKLKDYLDRVELLAKYLYQDSPDFLQVKEVKQIKQELDIPATTEQVVKDGVERLLAEKMEARDFPGEAICDSILLWRDYKAVVDSLSGQDRSWAGAVEYLLGFLNDSSWSPTQSEVAEVYEVSENTISNKYRQIEEKIGLPTTEGETIF